MEDIVGELSRLSSKFDVVFTSGGLGPTHDDITLKGVAAALGLQMRRSETMVATIQARYAAAVRRPALRGEGRSPRVPTPPAPPVRPLLCTAPRTDRASVPTFALMGLT